jgi:hypothetical protein
VRYAAPSAILLISTAALSQEEAVPLAKAHSHNDYLRKRPLLDALDHGFCSVEADIHLVDGRLLVAHDRVRTTPERTLEAMYLEPLAQRVKANNGRVYPGGPAFHLLIDIKAEPVQTYTVLRQALTNYAFMLTVFKTNQTATNAVTVIISGERPAALMAAEPERLAGLDGRPADLDANPSRHLAPWFSSSWLAFFKWRGVGDMPSDEREKLRQLVNRAHEQGRKVRFWATPDLPSVWREELAAGVDLINADDLPSLRRFLTSKRE